jgi:hypothetical protein
MALKHYTEPGGGFIREDGHHIPITLDAAAVDAGHTGFTTHLRRGLALGRITSSSKYAQYNDGASDGTQVCRGYLYVDVEMLDGGAAPIDRPAVLLVTGVVDQEKVIGSDAAARTDLDGKIWHV